MWASLARLVVRVVDAMVSWQDATCLCEDCRCILDRVCTHGDSWQSKRDIIDWYCETAPLTWHRA